MEKKQIRHVGLGLLDVLLIIFIVLKLCGVIAWPWVVVLIPLWITIGIVVIMLLAMAIVAGISKEIFK